MIIDLNQYDHVDEAPSLRISYDSLDQCHYIHRDFRGPFKTLVRVCLLRVSERDIRTIPLARTCLDELIRMGATYGGGICRLRHNDAARVLIRRIAELIEHDADLFPSPTNPALPDTGAEPTTVRLSEGNERTVRPEINEYAAVLQTLDVNFHNERLGEPYNEAAR